MNLIAPELSLYIHIPWCVQKCPYCDFNSHALKHDIDEAAYVKELIKDLDSDIKQFDLADRALHSIFIGGGTPSLFSPQAIASLLSQVLARFTHAKDIEITLEANPGTVESEKFAGFAKAGVNRLSIGVQSFESEKLIKLGRIHDSQQALNAASYAKEAGITSFNLDLMHGLPNQSLENALDDLKTAIELKPDHLSWYQLTIEPNTAFHSKPPKLPQDEVLWEIQDQGFKLLAEAGYVQYEISAFSQANKQCQHNLNYWQFGDYLGIGCGAHGKITDTKNQKIFRTVKVKHPKGYLDLDRSHLDHCHVVEASELPFEFMMNRLRLFSSFSLNDYQQRTGLANDTVLPQLLLAEQKGLMDHSKQRWQITSLGHRYLNDLLALFL
ncbi:radical SAM family heme chaperone HemW [Colwellia sp. RSH04]|uniref:radical SAM family heme chaperone HemW n=1 Tax=Colwellia sp. RSH04 TaxID=2305464 RepID=UPI000E5813EE|nr:radical SAM family heme chaperone HemW [Colwellia sp. RSH04]RHW75651.1 radical SAM family heme chaperone HemW [Colwellia sp. RSH04]